MTPKLKFPPTPSIAPYYLIAIDPGPHTGMVLVKREKSFREGKDVIRLIAQMTVDPIAVSDNYLQTIPYVRVLSWLDEFMPKAHQGARRLAIESFSTFQVGVGATSSAIATIRMCGAIEAWAQLNGIPVRWQTPASRVPYQESVRRYWKMDSPHTYSAMAHALSFIDGTDADARSSHLVFKYNPTDGSHETT